MTKRDISLNFCFISIRCYSCTLFVHVWWVQGPGVPVMYLFNEWCNQFLMNRIRSLWENQDLYRIMVVSICREQLTVSMITQLPRTLHRAVTRYGLTHVISISLPSHSIHLQRIQFLFFCLTDNYLELLYLLIQPSTILDLV